MCVCVCARTHMHTGFPVEGGCRRGKAKAYTSADGGGAQRAGTVPARHAGGTPLGGWGGRHVQGEAGW